MSIKKINENLSSVYPREIRKSQLWFAHVVGKI